MVPMTTNRRKVLRTMVALGVLTSGCASNEGGDGGAPDGTDGRTETPPPTATERERATDTERPTSPSDETATATDGSSPAETRIIGQSLVTVAEAWPINPYNPRVDGPTPSNKEAIRSPDVSLTNFVTNAGTMYSAGWEEISKNNLDGGEGWTKKHQFTSPPHLVDGQLLVEVNDSHLVSFSAATGERNWMQSIPDIKEEQMAVAADGQRVIYKCTTDPGVGGYKQELVGYDYNAEEIAWRTPLDFWMFGDEDYIAGGGRIVDGTLYVGANAYEEPTIGVALLDPETGEVERTIDHGKGRGSGWISTRPRFNSLLTVLESSRFYAVTWEQETQSSEATPHVVALDRESGEQVWKKDTKHRLIRRPTRILAADEDTAYYPTDDGLAAFAAEDGEKRWTHPLLSDVTGRIGVTAKHVYVPTEKNLQVIDVESGEKVGVFEHAGGVPSILAITDTHVYVR